jgi:hypothetical protein
MTTLSTVSTSGSGAHRAPGGVEQQDAVPSARALTVPFARSSAVPIARALTVPIARALTVMPDNISGTDIGRAQP